MAEIRRSDAIHLALQWAFPDSQRGQDANHIGFQMFFTRADSFDVSVKVDNIHLKPKP